MHLFNHFRNFNKSQLINFRINPKRFKPEEKPGVTIVEQGLFFKSKTKLGSLL